MLNKLKSGSILLLALGALFSPTLWAAPAPDFKLPTQSGNVTLSELRGQVVYVDFWASWCKPCRESFPWMNDLQARYGDKGLKVIAINLDEDRVLAEQFLEQLPAKFTVAFDSSGKTASDYKVMGMPSSYLIDRQGELQMSHVGFRSRDLGELEKAVRGWLAK